MKKQKSSNEYVNEIELKSLIIRINNKSVGTYSETDVKRLNKYIKKHTKNKSHKFRKIMKDYIIKISERNTIDKDSYERFGELILLIIKNILKKPKFSGYTYRDEFYSDSTDKIFRYLHNFNHKLISERTGQSVNAFSYISQIIHNSILFIINTKNSEKHDIERYVKICNEKIETMVNESTYINNDSFYIIKLNTLKKSLYDDILDYKLEKIKETDIIVQFSKNYKISLDEYEKIKSINTKYKKNIITERI